MSHTRSYAAANLDFEDAAGLRDEIKRLRQVELVIAEDPLARQQDVEERAGKATRSGGGKGDMRQKRSDPMSRPHKPSLDEMGPHSERVLPRKRTKQH